MIQVVHSLLVSAWGQRRSQNRLAVASSHREGREFRTRTARVPTGYVLSIDRMQVGQYAFARGELRDAQKRARPAVQVAHMYCGRTTRHRMGSNSFGEQP